MSSIKLSKLGFLGMGIALLTLSAAQGCSSDDDDQISPIGGRAGTAGRTDDDAGESPSTGGSGDVGGEGGEGDTPSDGGDAGTGGDAGGEAGGSGPVGGSGGTGGAVSCDGPKGCYACEPKTPTQFANQCVPGGCPATFNNNTLTKLNLVGTLN